MSKNNWSSSVIIANNPETIIIKLHRSGPWPKHMITDLNYVRGLIQAKGYPSEKIELHLPRKIVDQIRSFPYVPHKPKDIVLEEILGMKIFLEDTDSENVTALVKEVIDPNISYVPIKVNLFP